MAVAGELHTSCCAKGVDGGGGVFFQDTWSALPPITQTEVCPQVEVGMGGPENTQTAMS